jgi:hypothetical protein
MEQFDHILNWQLKQGSHPFPGKDGGTCINEAAIVAAGFPYQRVVQVEHMPACFSRPMCKLAMLLNDHSTDVDRQRLLPFVAGLVVLFRHLSPLSGESNQWVRPPVAVPNVRFDPLARQRSARSSRRRAK